MRTHAALTTTGLNSENTQTSLQKYKNFSDIVDVDEGQAYEDYISEVLCGRLVESEGFRMIILIAIVLNTVLVGMQTSSVLTREYGAYMQGLDEIFVTIFAVEIFLKWFHDFWAFWTVGWNVFDFILVFISIIGDGLTFLSTGRVLRIFRVLRAFRSLRSISVLKGLQIVVQTIIRSLPDMANILALLLIVMFIFSVIGVDIFAAALPEHFGSISDTMFTLFIFMTQDGWVDIYNDMQDAGKALEGAIFTVIFVVIGALVFANIIVGVTVTNLQTAYKEMKLTKIVRHRALTGNKNSEVKELNQDTVNSDHIKPQVLLKQKPYKLPDFRNLTIESLENYYLVLIALEENMKERQDIRATLEHIIQEIELWNPRDKKGGKKGKGKKSSKSKAGGKDKGGEKMDTKEGAEDVEAVTIEVIESKHSSTQVIEGIASKEGPVVSAKAKLKKKARMLGRLSKSLLRVTAKAKTNSSGDKGSESAGQDDDPKEDEDGEEDGDKELSMRLRILRSSSDALSKKIAQEKTKTLQQFRMQKKLLQRNRKQLLQSLSFTGITGPHLRKDSNNSVGDRSRNTSHDYSSAISAAGAIGHGSGGTTGYSSGGSENDEPRPRVLGRRNSRRKRHSMRGHDDETAAILSNLAALNLANKGQQDDNEHIDIAMNLPGWMRHKNMRRRSSKTASLTRENSLAKNIKRMSQTSGSGSDPENNNTSSDRSRNESALVTSENTKSPGLKRPSSGGRQRPRLSLSRHSHVNNNPDSMGVSNDSTVNSKSGNNSNSDSNSEARNSGSRRRLSGRRSSGSRIIPGPDQQREQKSSPPLIPSMPPPLPIHLHRQGRQSLGGRRQSRRGSAGSFIAVPEQRMQRRNSAQMGAVVSQLKSVHTSTGLDLEQRHARNSLGGRRHSRSRRASDGMRSNTVIGKLSIDLATSAQPVPRSLTRNMSSTRRKSLGGRRMSRRGSSGGTTFITLPDSTMKRRNSAQMVPPLPEPSVTDQAVDFEKLKQQQDQKKQARLARRQSRRASGGPFITVPAQLQRRNSAQMSAAQVIPPTLASINADNRAVTGATAGSQSPLKISLPSPSKRASMGMHRQSRRSSGGGNFIALPESTLKRRNSAQMAPPSPQPSDLNQTVDFDKLKREHEKHKKQRLARRQSRRASGGGGFITVPKQLQRRNSAQMSAAQISASLDLDSAKAPPISQSPPTQISVNLNLENKSRSQSLTKSESSQKTPQKDKRQSLGERKKTRRSHGSIVISGLELTPGQQAPVQSDIPSSPLPTVHYRSVDLENHQRQNRLSRLSLRSRRSTGRSSGEASGSGSEISFRIELDREQQDQQQYASQTSGADSDDFDK